MNKADILCGMDRKMMREFSRRSLERLMKSPAFKLALTLASGLMDANVGKEIEKDAIFLSGM